MRDRLSARGRLFEERATYRCDQVARGMEKRLRASISSQHMRGDAAVLGAKAKGAGRSSPTAHRSEYARDIVGAAGSLLDLSTYQRSRAYSLRCANESPPRRLACISREKRLAIPHTLTVTASELAAAALKAALVAAARQAALVEAVEEEAVA